MVTAGGRGGGGQGGGGRPGVKLSRVEQSRVLQSCWPQGAAGRLGAGGRGGSWHGLRWGCLGHTSACLPWPVEPMLPFQFWPALPSSRKPSRWPPLDSCEPFPSLNGHTHTHTHTLGSLHPAQTFTCELPKTVPGQTHLAPCLGPFHQAKHSSLLGVRAWGRLTCLKGLEQA